jgi:hypothetical protein
MRRSAVEHIRDRLAFIRGESADVDERLHLLAQRRRDHGAGIGVADQDDRRGDALERSIERCDIVAERCQRQRRGDRLDAIGRQRRDHLRPA